MVPKSNQESTTLIYFKPNVKQELIRKDKYSHSKIIKRTTYPEDIIIFNIYASKIDVLSFVKWTLQDVNTQK